MKRNPALSIVSILPVSCMFMSCGGNSGSSGDGTNAAEAVYETQYLPQGYKLTLPASIKASGGGGAGFKVARRRHATFTEDFQGQSCGYT